MSLQSEEDLRPTLRAGSEEYIEFVCDSCITENCRKVAEGHCIDCVQNICNDCIKYHKKIAVLKNHIIEDEPKHTSNQGSSGILNRDEVKTLQSGLKKLDETLNVYKAASMRFQTEVIKSADNVVDQIKQWRTEMNKTLDELENELLQKTNGLRTDSVNSLKENSTASEDMITETKRLLKDLEDKRNLSRTNYLFISVKQAQTNLPRLQEEVDRIGEQCKPHRLSFYPHENVTTMLSTLGLGTVSLSGDPADIKAIYEREIGIKLNTYTSGSVIEGATVLSDGRLCLCDIHNKSIKLIETKLMKISELALPNKPIDVALINDCEIAVTINNYKNLQILSVSPTLRLSRTIPLPAQYNGIAHCEEKLLLAWRASSDNYGGIDICDMTGNRIKRIETNVDGTKIFTSTRRVCVGPDHSTIYVTDDKAHSVVCMNMDGDVMNVYRNEKLKTPCGITVDPDGNVYVCCHDTNNVYQLTRTGESIQVLLDHKDGLKFPKTISYWSGHLYISSGSNAQALENNIKIFGLFINDPIRWRTWPQTAELDTDAS